MTRKLFSLAAMLLVLYRIVLPASGTSGSITVELDASVKVSLYLVGAWEDGGYRLLEPYGGGFLTFDDILSDDLARWLAGRAEGGISRETDQGAVKFTDLNEGLYLVAQTPEGAVEQKFSPFLVSLPWDGNRWDVQIVPQVTDAMTELPQTGDFWGFRISAVFMMLSMLGLLVIGSRKKY